MEQYQTMRSEVIGPSGDWKGVRKTVPMISDTKIANLSDTAKLYINNTSINDMSDAEIRAIYENIELEEYVAMIGVFAKTWHNSLAAS